MHYIRLLKPPSIIFPGSNPKATKLPPASSSILVSTKITITTDLGDSFLLLPLPIIAFLLDSTGSNSSRQNFLWKSGARSLDILLAVPRDEMALLKWPCRVVVQAGEEERRWEKGKSLDERENIGREGDTESEGKVLGLESELLVLGKSEDVERRVRRKIGNVGGEGVHIWEEMGESIARHIWDAGLIMSSLFTSLPGSNESNPATTSPQLPLLRSTLASNALQVLELGTGVGIVSVRLAKSCPHASIILTDLPEAEEIVKYNISKAPELSRQRLTYQNLDWSEPLPSNLQNQNFNLVLVSDCTYNPDVVPHLVNTLSSIITSSPRALIVVAMKVRHENESIFFDLMKAQQLRIVDKVVIQLPHLGEEAQEIELWLFKG